MMMYLVFYISIYFAHIHMLQQHFPRLLSQGSTSAVVQSDSEVSQVQQPPYDNAFIMGIIQ